MNQTELVTLFVTLLTAFGGIQIRNTVKFNRLARENRALWYYTRHLIDWGYRPRDPEDVPPEPPSSIAHLYEYGDTK